MHSNLWSDDVAARVLLENREYTLGVVIVAKVHGGDDRVCTRLCLSNFSAVSHKDETASLTYTFVTSSFVVVVVVVVATTTQEFRRLSAASAHLQSRVALFGTSTSGSSAAGAGTGGQEEGDHVALNIGGSSSNYR